MPAEATPIRQLARRSLRVHAVLIGVIMLATLQTGLVVSTTLRLLDEEHRRIEFHFRRLTGAARETERFMHRWRAQDRIPRASSGSPSLRPGAGGSAAEPEVPFAVLHDNTAVPAAMGRLGTRLAAFYAAFWADSHFPSPRCLLVNGNGTAGLLVPLKDDNDKAADTASPPARPILDYVRGVAATASLQRGDIHWFPRELQAGDRRLLAVAPSPHDAAEWEDSNGATVPAMACLLDVDRLDDYRQVLGEPIYDGLSIIGPQGDLLYGPPIPAATRPVRRFTRDGVVYRMRSDSGWQAEYRVAWSRVLSQPRGPLIGSVLLALLLTAGGILLLRGYRRSVLLPLRAHHERLLESEAFSRTVLDAAPIGLCLLRQGDGRVILENDLARAWLGKSHAAPGWQGAWRARALGDVAIQRPAGSSYTTPEGRHLLVTATAARYRGEPVMLCLFIDLTAQHRAEQVLEQARNAADQANQAKSLFLATMSHEIRTPLYGVLGTLELLGLTPLDSRQQQYVGTIQRSSSMLMQLISDILDVSKAEAGQLTLEPVAFSPSELTEEVLRSYAGAATRKRLQLYACLGDTAPPLVLADAARIRQVLNNLVSNAIKFTDGGRIVVRLRAQAEPGQPPSLCWQVADTGIGIAQEHQARLFDPFYQANPGADAARGTGLGLAISAHLVHLMGGQLRVVSEAGLGSSFSFDIPLHETPQTPPERPRFASPMLVLVRSPSRELADDLCDRLRLRGASAQVFHADAAGNYPDDTPLLDVTLDEPVEPWTGPWILARPDGGDHPEQAGEHWVVSMHNLDAMVEAILRATGTEAAVAVPLPATPQHRLGLHVLVAEDNPINQMILREQLEQLGCHAVVAGDGDEALGYWAQRHFDVVLTDINMPHIDGYALARRLREQGTAVPIVGATANAAPEERERCRAAGMDSCLVKPISLQTLYRELSSITGGPARPFVDGPAEATAPADVLVVPPHLRELFLSTMRSDLQGLTMAVDNGQLDSLRQALHRIRGALVMVSAQGLVDQAQQIEDDIASGAGPAACTAATRAFMAHLERILVRLERLPPETPDVH